MDNSWGRENPSWSRPAEEPLPEAQTPPLGRGPVESVGVISEAAVRAERRAESAERPMATCRFSLRALGTFAPRVRHQVSEVSV